jgi:hypothetical protein
MSSRKRDHNDSNNNNNQNKEEKTSSNMSIDEDSVLNDNPSSTNRDIFNSFNTNHINNTLSNNIIKIPKDNVFYNTQQRPTLNLELFENSGSNPTEVEKDLGKNTIFT